MHRRHFLNLSLGTGGAFLLGFRFNVHSVEPSVPAGFFEPNGFIRIDPDGTNHQLHIHKVTAAVFCGQVINLEGAEQQIAGSIIDGLNAALFGNMVIKGNAAAVHNFDGYRMLRLSEAPPLIDVHFVESHEPPRGLGEMGLPPLAPALCNAIFAATGKRIRKLPIGDNGF